MQLRTCSLTIRTLPHRSHTIRRNHDGNARRGSSSASAPDGRGSLPWTCVATRHKMKNVGKRP